MITATGITWPAVSAERPKARSAGRPAKSKPRQGKGRSAPAPRLARSRGTACQQTLQTSRRLPSLSPKAELRRAAPNLSTADRIPGSRKAIAAIAHLSGQKPRQRPAKTASSATRAALPLMQPGRPPASPDPASPSGPGRTIACSKRRSAHGRTPAEISQRARRTAR